MKNKIFMSVALLFVGLTAVAQRTTKAAEADYSFLKGVKKINVVFDYEGMTVGKNMTEVDYVAQTVAEKNEKKPGAGDEWKEAWEKGKLNLYEPAFITSLNKKLKKMGFEASQGDDAEMTLIVKITRLEPGFYSYAVNKDAELDMLMSFVETANHDNITSQVVMTNVHGAEAASVSGRLVTAFNMTGAILGKYIAKALK